MTEKSDREELKRRPEQTRRTAKDSFDSLNKERLQKLVRDLEEQLR
jgi:hypothetical protein